MAYERSDADPADDDTPLVRWDTLADLATAYWAERPGDDDGNSGPAQQAVRHLIDSGHADCVALLSALATTANDDDAICFVGAGPVEDLMSHTGQGARFISELERKVAENQRLAAAIKCVWVGDGVSDDVRRRLVAMGATNIRSEL